MGRPKAWLPFGDEVLLQRVVRILSKVVNPIVVVAAPGQDLPQLPPQVRIVRDEREYLGPLNGLAEGLTALDGLAEIAYLSSCDVPFVQPAFVRRVIDCLAEVSLCMPDVGGYKHPLASAYRVDVLPVVRRLLSENRLRPAFLADLVPTHFLRDFDFVDVDPDLKSLRNVNTPAEYEAALRDVGQATS